nr:hypothetical protein [Tanacetum cinerariifolium]
MIIDTIVDAAQVTTTVTDIPISTADTMVTTTPIIEATKTTVEVPQVPKVRGITIADLEESTTTTKTHSSQPLVKHRSKGKAIMIEIEPEEYRLEIEKAQQKLEANEALINTFDDIQARIDADAQLAQQILDSRGAIPSNTAIDAKVAIQEMDEYSRKWHNRTSRTKSTETSDGLASLQAQLNNHGREIKKVNEKFYVAQEGDIEQQLRDSATGKIRPIFSTAHAKIDVFKRKITLRVGEEKIIFKSVKPASSLIKRVYMLSLRDRMELDLEAMLMGETLVLNRSLDPFFGAYTELNDLNVPLELRRDQADDLMPTMEEGKDTKCVTNVSGNVNAASGS